ncbi:tetratricopeptide repeat-containing glycosyltransferase family 2 protein [Clostridium paraputrificum]|nr:glycosyltransferase [Clostridium paraputrificum]
MIVRDEESNLEKCLLSVRDYIDEIIIVDTGSKDRTKEIASKYTKYIYDFKWNNDFAKARNFSISKASNSWVLILDADEVVSELDFYTVLNFCKKDSALVGRINIINEYEDQHGIKRYTKQINRFFNKNFYKYEGIIHEQLVAKDKQQYIAENLPITLQHIGYSKEVVNKKNKIERNISLLLDSIEQKDNDPYLYYQLGKSYFMAKKFKESSINFEKAIDLIDNFYYEYAEDLVESYGYSLLNIRLYEKALVIKDYNKYYLNSADFKFLIAMIEMNNGNFQRAAETFLECTSYREGKIEGITTFLPLYNIGVIFEALGFEDEALKYYEMCGEYRAAKERINSLKGEINY